MLGSRQTANFCSHLKMLLASGMPLLESINIIKNLPFYDKRRRQWEDAMDKINDGSPLSSSIKTIVPALVVSSIKSAEYAGSLETTLDQLSSFYRGRAELEEKFKAALVYPSFVVGLSVLVMAAVMVFILPGFKSLFADLGGELPLFTRIVMSMSNYWYIIFVLLILGFVAVRPHFLRLPVINKLYKQEMVIQGLGSLGALLKGGVPIIEALQTTAQSAAEDKFRAIIMTALSRVENGEKLSRAFEESRFFPPEVIQMLKVGESSGQLAEMLLSIADFQAQEREAYLKKLTALIEPAMTLSVGVIVSVVVLAMFLPLVNMVSSLQ